MIDWAATFRDEERFKDLFEWTGKLGMETGGFTLASALIALPLVLAAQSLDRIATQLEKQGARHDQLDGV